MVGDWHRLPEMQWRHIEETGDEWRLVEMRRRGDSVAIQWRHNRDRLGMRGDTGEMSG